MRRRKVEVVHVSALGITLCGTTTTRKDPDWSNPKLTGCAACLRAMTEKYNDLVGEVEETNRQANVMVDRLNAIRSLTEAPPEYAQRPPHPHARRNGV